VLPRPPGCKYYDPLTREGLGARCFSWSALLLDLLADNEAEGHGIVTETGGEQGDSSL